MSWLIALGLVTSLGLSCAPTRGCPQYPSPPKPTAYAIEQTEMVEGTALGDYLMELVGFAAAVKAGNESQ